MSHTPGPWYAQGFVAAYDDMGPVGDLCRIVDDKGHPFIYVRTRPDDVMIRTESGISSANVQLVRLAPSLLAALEEIMGIIGHLPAKSGQNVDEMLEKLRNANLLLARLRPEEK